MDRVELLYHTWSDNVLETEKLQRAYLKASDTLDELDELIDSLKLAKIDWLYMDCVEIAKEEAFKAGFLSAIKFCKECEVSIKQ